MWSRFLPLPDVLSDGFTHECSDTRVLESGSEIRRIAISLSIALEADGYAVDDSVKDLPRELRRVSRLELQLSSPCTSAHLRDAAHAG